jgi:AcrR family transcriptional regulator
MNADNPTSGRRAQIQRVTLALAFELGPERVTTGLIAKRLGVTQPAIYKHFAGKEDLWQSITELLAEQIADNIAQAAATARNPLDHLRRLVLGHLDLVRQTPALPEIMVSRNQKGAQKLVQHGMRASTVALSDALTGAIRAAQADGSLRSDIAAEDMSILVLGTVQSLVLRLLVSRNLAVLEADAERLLDLQLSAFTPRQGEQR